MNQLVLKKKNELMKKKKGFTLVELIIVIAIIAILAAIAIPKFGTIKEDANNKANVATGKTIATLVAKEIANDNITTMSSTKLDSIKWGTAPNEVTLISQLDGTTVPKGGGDFYVVVGADKNITVNVINGSNTTQVFPQS